jgi:hypothetical protein
VATVQNFWDRQTPGVLRVCPDLYRDSFTFQNNMKVYSWSRCVTLLGTEVLLGHIGLPNCNVKDVYVNVLPKFVGKYKIKFEGTKTKIDGNKIHKVVLQIVIWWPKNF